MLIVNIIVLLTVNIKIGKVNNWLNWENEVVCGYRYGIVWCVIEQSRLEWEWGSGGILLCIIDEKNNLCLETVSCSSEGHCLSLFSLCVGSSLRRHASIWSTVACICVVCKIQSWKAGSSRGVGQLGSAGSQLLMWLAAWLTPLRCWGDGEIQWPQATTEVGRMPPPSRASFSLCF
jgi:hypothetical protein